jgi:hypothetical protein
MAAQTPQPNDQQKKTMRIEMGPDADVEEVIPAICNAYEKFYCWDTIISEAELDSVQNGHSWETPVRQLSLYRVALPAEEKLRIEEIRTASGGMLEATGIAGPVERLERYYQNRHVDWDRKAKEPSEDRRLELENQRTEVLRDGVELLHGLGFPEIQIREALSEYVFAPRDRLERYGGVKISSAVAAHSASEGVQPHHGDGR